VGKKKSVSTQTYQSLPHVATADEGAYRNSIQGVDFHSPIVNAYGQAENDINDTTFEEQLPPGVAERIKNGRMFNLRQRKGADLSAAAAQESAFKTGNLGSLAGMTQNQYANAGGTNTQSGVSTGEMLGFAGAA
jgi:hypothetical protein